MSKISKKTKNAIIDAIKDAFVAKVSEYKEYDNAPEMWQREERELWDNLSDLVDRAISNVKKVIN